MNWNWRSLFRARAAAAGTTVRPKVDRRTAVVVASAAEADDLLLDLGAARVDSVRLLNVTLGEPEGTSEPVARSWRVLHPQRAGRVRAWSLDEVIAGEAIPVEPLRADVALVPIELDRLSYAEAPAAAMLDTIQGALLAMRRQGRLCRVAVVITGDRGQVPLRHASQARLPEWPREDLRDALGRELRRGDIPGHPLGDRAWCAFLREDMLGRPALLAFLESVRRLVPGRAAVFFVRQGDGESAGIEQLVAWIDRPGGAGDETRRGAPSRAFRVALGGAIAATLLLLALPPVWIGVATDKPASPGAALEWIDSRLRGYDAFAGLPNALLGHGSARADVLRARDIVRDEVAVDALREQLEARIAREIAGRLLAGDVARRSERAERIDQEVRIVESLVLPVLDDARGRFAAKSGRARARLWTSLARAQTAIALLRLEPRNRGFDGFTLDSAQAARLDARWREARREDVARRFGALTEQASASAFYRAFDRIAADSVASELRWADLAPAVPRIRQGDAIPARRRDEFETLGRDEFKSYVEPSNEAPPEPRTMKLSFTNPDDGSWHVDVARAGGRFVAARWVAGAKAADGCQLQLSEATPGEVLRIAYCAVSRDHVLLSGRTTDGSGEIRTLVLGEPTGQVKFAKGVVLDYAVVSGWDGAPQQTGEKP